MAQEVELRALISAAELKTLPSKLKQLGFKPAGQMIVQDKYYCPISARSFKDIEMNEVGSYSLRLRSMIAKGERKSELNVKTITQHGDHHSWKENEIEVDSIDEADAILKTLGFKVFFDLYKKRTVYNKGSVKVWIENIKDFQPAIELEILTDHRGSDKAKEKLHGILRDLGISNESIVSKSITNLLMKKLAHF